MNDTAGNPLKDKNASPGEDMFAWVEVLNDIGSSLSSQENIHLLLEEILKAAKKIVNADGGTIYQVVDGKALKFEIMLTDSLNIAQGGSSGKEITIPPLPLYDAEGKANKHMVAAYCFLEDKTVNIKDAYVEQGFDFSGTKKFDQSTGYRSTSFLTVPMKNHEKEIIGVLQLINAKHRQTGEVIPFSENDQRFAESLASQAAVALTNRQLIRQLEDLFESFIGVINDVIDEKSPYTGGHCERVPVLTMMLAEAANSVQYGPFKDFHMTEKDLSELRIAGLLHDCGKIATPVHVVDKSSKLETICDRIDLVATRFEVKKRDAQIEFLKSSMEHPDKKERLEREYQKKLEQYDEDLAFLRKSNMGSERMSDEDVARVEEIARSYAWPDGSPFLSPNEVENLTIRAGTLTAAERQIINRHIDVTISMLESLPWPKHLKNVPAYAGGHHERMDGKGYPKGLTREQMPPQARIMGIADIFEALTAKDRPYKKMKPLSETLNILGKMCLGGHIDPELFDIFIREKVYLRYAKEFLDAELIDEIDTSNIPGYKE